MIADRLIYIDLRYQNRQVKLVELITTALQI